MCGDGQTDHATFQKPQHNSQVNRLILIPTVLNHESQPIKSCRRQEAINFEIQALPLWRDIIYHTLELEHHDYDLW
jgi:hypothetical protein